jgi:hypothetical protein
MCRISLIVKTIRFPHNPYLLQAFASCGLFRGQRQERAVWFVIEQQPADYAASGSMLALK